MTRKKKNWFTPPKRRAAVISASVFFLFLLSLVIYAEKKLSNLVLGGLGERFSTKVYSAPYWIKNKSAHSADLVVERLKRLNYKKKSGEYLAVGEYLYDFPYISIYLKGFESPQYIQNALVVHAKVDKKSRWLLVDNVGHPISEIGIEPEQITELLGPKKIRREPAQWNDFPSHLVDAVTVAEDHKFFDHWGVRPLAILRALIHNLTKKGALHGGSTITQQLAKNLFLTPQRTLRRKFLEAFLAVYLELRYSKERILTIYLNHIYLGQDGYTSLAGVEAAVNYYFGKKLNQITISESALLAGLIRSPLRYDPFRNSENSKNRRDFVLRRMQKVGKINADQLYEAENAPLPSKQQRHNKESKQGDYFVAEVVRQLTPTYGEDALYRFGLKIYTTMDPLYQKYAEDAVKQVQYQTAFVAIDPLTGNVKALVGGKNFKESQFNRATQAIRQPGSAFKPFAYAAALEEGFTASDFIFDELRQYDGNEEDEELWEPKNFNDIYLGSVTLRTALANSINAATLDLVEKLGPYKVVSFARRCGIESPLESTLAIGLGVYEVTPIELTAAYAPFVNGGFRIKPILITSLIDSEGALIEMDPPRKESVLDPGLTFLATSLMKSVVKKGTAKHLKAMGWERPAAGKTGTTNGGKDAWFIGYTPRDLAGVWVGHDEAKPIDVSGGAHALPVWASFMKKINHNTPIVDFVKPGSLLELTIDPVSGKLAQSGCPEKMTEFYIRGNEPTEKCSLHKGGIRGWFQNLFRKKGKEEPIPQP